MHQTSRRRMFVGAAAIAVALALSGCAGSAGATAGQGASGTTTSGTIVAVGAENQYADVISQIGGKYVSVSAVMSNPNTDPHSFEASASVARTISEAGLIVQNGLGYDGFMTKIEASVGGGDRRVIVAQKVLGLPNSTPNPHLWYDPKTMPAVAKSIAKALTALRPAHREYFERRLAAFTSSLTKWTEALAAFKADHPDTPVAVTEPVADYMLEAAGASIKTPLGLEQSVMNDTDPAPQDVAKQDALFTSRSVKAFVYNRQVTDAITSRFLQLARDNRIPIVGVYETMPTHGYTYQSWMLAQLDALRKAVELGESTERL